MRFTGKVVFITGGASGIGAATARRFADEGAVVAVADVNTVGAERLAKELPDAFPLTVDTSDPAEVQSAVDRTVEHYGRIDVVVNNAGVSGAQQPLHETTLENWTRVRSVNGDGMFFVMRYGIAAMLRTGGGVVVNMSSIAGMAVWENISPYTFTKSGIIGLTRSAAVEYANRNIRVNAVAPTAVMTPMVENFIAESADPPQMRAQLTELNPMPGMPTPEDVAAVIAFLASDDARWITGHTVPVDGGYVAR